jgi:hypothetical protein
MQTVPREEERPVAISHFDWVAKLAIGFLNACEWRLRFSAIRSVGAAVSSSAAPRRPCSSPSTGSACQRTGRKADLAGRSATLGTSASPVGAGFSRQDGLDLFHISCSPLIRGHARRH